MSLPPIQICQLGLQPYVPVWRAMQDYTEHRDTDSTDQIWLVEHPPVFTQGMNGKPEHILQHGDIPVVEVDRGGQVTYHGPGQAVVYLLLDLRRAKLGVRHAVSAMESAIIQLLSEYGIHSRARQDAPGVYVQQDNGDEAKIASVGLRVRKGCTFHGLAFNVNMELEPFQRINPCGYAGMPVTDLNRLHVVLKLEQVQQRIATLLAQQLHRQSEIVASPPLLHGH